MPIRVYYEVLNQKGTPALYSDNYAQRPAAGYQGRIFNSPDTGQIFYDTGTTWTLLADAGVGSGSLASVCANGNTTATGISITAGGLSTDSLTSTNLTAGSIPFVGTGGLITQDNANLFWDDTTNRLGLGTIIPTAPFDIHTTANIGIQINNTTTADSKIAFLQADAGKWRIGNLYSGGANLFHIYNNVGVTLAMQIDSSNAALFYGSLSANSFIRTNGGLSLIHNSVPTSTGYTGIGGLTAGLSIALASGFNQTLTFPTGVAYTYTYPAATGTLALTSDLSSYLPLAGGTLSGGLTINSTLYINPTNTSLTGLDVASNNISFRSDNLEGSKRQLAMTMGSGTLIQFTAQGYGAARTTDIAFYTSAAGGVNGTPAIYLTGGNNVGIGTGSPAYKLDVSGIISSTTEFRLNASYIRVASSDSGGGFGGGYNFNWNNGSPVHDSTGGLSGYGYASDGTVRFYTDGSAAANTSAPIRMRITSNGFSQFTSSNAFTSLSNNAHGFITNYSSDNMLYLIHTAASPFGPYFYFSGAAPNNTSNYFLTCEDTVNGKAIIYSNGTFGSRTSTYGGISDINLKENIISATNKLDDLLKVNVVNYNFIDDINKDKQLGVIAQELETIFPNMVYESIDRNGASYKNVKYSIFIPMLIKAVQELNQKIENLN